MRWKPAPILGGAYSDDAKAWSVQDTVNYIPVVAEKQGTRTPAMFRGAPGFSTFCDLGTNAPVRGTHDVEGLLLAVSGNTLFKVSATGVPTAIGAIPGVERVSMAHNQITGGNEVAIANGQSGYVYNTVTGTLTQITDDGFPGSISFEFDDGYILGIEPGRRFAFHSMLADATNYNTLDRYEAEGSPDKIVGQIVTHREWWLFGERTIEPYVNTGDATDTFQRSSGTVIEIGLAARYAVVQMDNSVFWLGQDGVVYRANGYTPLRISTHAIEQAISRTNTSLAFAFTFDDKGHQIVYFTFPDGMTWGYDAASGEWHRRQSYGLNRWRINNLVKSNRDWIAGDYTNGKLYKLDWATQTEDGAILERRRITGVLSDNQNPVTVNGVALIFDTGEESVKPPELAIAGSIPSVGCGVTIAYDYTATGGFTPYKFTTQGNFPLGLVMGGDGHVFGEVAVGGEYAWSVTVEDKTGTKSTLIEDRTGDNGFWGYLTSYLYAIEAIESASAWGALYSSQLIVNPAVKPFDFASASGFLLDAVLTTTTSYQTYSALESASASGVLTDAVLTTTVSYQTYSALEAASASGVLTDAVLTVTTSYVNYNNALPELVQASGTLIGATLT